MKDLSPYVDKLRSEMIVFLTEMCRIKAIAPESVGDGGAERASFILMQLSRLGFKDVEVIEIKDARVSAGYRPNIIVTIDRKSVV